MLRPFSYTIMERKIYTYDQGPELIKVDPLPVSRKLFTSELLHDAQLSDLAYKDSQTATPNEKMQEDGRAANERLREATRNIFGLKPYTFDNGVDSGWLEEEVDDLLIHFTEWITELKKNTPTSPTSPAPTQEPWQWHQYSDLPMSHTQSSWASNSIETELNIGI